MYGGSYRLFSSVCEKFGLEFTYVDTSKRRRSPRGASAPNTKIVFLETPTNPMMTITDIAACAEVAHKRDALVVVDNTFCSPYLQRPIELGADIVVHSTTKFLNGHSDSVGGVVITNSDEIAEQIGFLQNAVGAILSPFDSWLVLRGVKTLAVRMKQHEENGRAMAELPVASRQGEEGLLPRPPRPPAARAGQTADERLRRDDLVRARLARQRQEVPRPRPPLLPRRIARRRRDADLAPRDDDARLRPVETRKRLGITPGLVRISVGIEDIEDLIADLDQAFAAM